MIAWLLDPANSGLVGSAVSAFVAIIASGTALLVALFSYPRQKRLDRELQLDEEKREAFRAFFSVLESMINSSATEDKSKQLDLILACKNAINLLSLLTDAASAEECWKLYSSASKLSNALAYMTLEEREENPDEYRKWHEDVVADFSKAMNAARSEIGLDELAIDDWGILVIGRN